MSHIWRELCLLLLSLSHTQGFPADKCLIASVGETIQLPCSLKTEEPLNIENISLEWTAGDLTLFCLRSYECRVNYFQPKSNFFISEIPHGNFSLRLFSVSLYDERSYSCYYRAAGECHKRLVCEHCLHVGDRFSDPVLLGPTSPVLNGTEVNFTCKSDEGFPVPWVQWFVNKKPFQDKSRIKNKLKRGRNPKYNLTSVLTLTMTENVSVSCMIDNRKMEEKKTSPEKEYLIKTEIDPHRANGKAWAIAASVSALAVVLLIGKIVMIKRIRMKHHEASVTNKDLKTEMLLQQPTANEKPPEAEHL